MKERAARTRATDKGAAAVAGNAAVRTSKTFWKWVEFHHIDSLAVLVVTLWLTVGIVTWALEFSYAAVPETSGAERAGIIAAVMTPWGLMQAAMTKWYMELKAKSNVNGNGDNK